MQFSVRLLAVRLLAALFIVSLTACGGHSKNSSQITLQHLYVGNDNTPGQILQFTLPLTNSSTPTVTLSTSNTNNVLSLAVDSSGNLVSGDTAGRLAIFNAPITSASAATATFNNGSAISAGQLAFNSVGDLFATSTSTNINLFTHPLTSSSTPSTVISGGGITAAIGATLDANGNLFVSNSGVSSSNLAVFAPPYTGAPTVTPVVAGAFYRKVALTSTQLFVSNVAGATGQVDVYNLPLTASSAPAFSIINVNAPEAVAFDSSGNLYVGNFGDATIRVFTPPFSASSSPSVTLKVSTGAFSVFGIAIGK